MAASCRTWFITAALGSEDEAPSPRPLLMLSISADLVGVDCNILLLIVWVQKTGIEGCVTNSLSEFFRLCSAQKFPSTSTMLSPKAGTPRLPNSGTTGISKPPIQEAVSVGLSQTGLQKGQLTSSVFYETSTSGISLLHLSLPFLFSFSITLLTSALRSICKLGNLRVRE
jgi:hypothetical protein